MAAKSAPKNSKPKTDRSRISKINSEKSGYNTPNFQVENRFDEVGDEFFEELYIALNPDVASAVQEGAVASGADHWAKFGHLERVGTADLRTTLRFGPPARSVIDIMSHKGSPTAGFDPFSYFYLNPDVLRVSDGSAEAALDHWVKHGRIEGRVAPGILRTGFREFDLESMLARPAGINVFGPLATISGLGTAARATAKAVKASGVPFELNAFDLTSGELRPSASEARTQPTYRVNLLIVNADSVARIFAAYPPGFFDNAYNIAIWQWELASPRADSFYAFEGIDEVWTNSAFQVEAIRATAPVPVTRIHLPVVASATPTPADRASFGIPEEQYVFLVAFDVGSTSARKNPLAVIEVFKKVKAERPNVHLVLKYHSAKYEEGFIRSLLAAIAGSTAITVVSAELSLRQLDSLRASCDCLVSAHRSEGFGLNLAEFLSLGKPVIATNYSGNVDFFDEAVGFPIDFELKELSQQAGPYQSGFVWANPSSRSLEVQMLRVVDDAAEVVKRGRVAALRISSLLSLETVGDAIAKRIAALQLGESVPTFARTMGKGDKAARQTLSGNSAAKSLTLTALQHRPLLSVVVPVYNVPANYLQDCLRSVFSQSYPFWELCICDDCSTEAATVQVLDAFRGTSPLLKIIKSPVNGGISDATNRAIHIATGEFIVFLDNDDVLEPTALEEVARALSSDPDLDILYSDEIKIDAAGNQIDHYFKPDWSPEHLESVMYVLHLLVVRKRLLLELGGLRPEFTGAQDYDLMLRCSRATTRIHHIKKALYQWRAIPGSAASVVDAKPTALENGKRALADHARQKYGPLARVEPGLLPGTFRLRRSLQFPPQVSLLILTGNTWMDLPGKGKVSMIENLVASIKSKTDYPNYQIVVVDNSKLTSDQIRAFEADGIQVSNFESKGPFNYAAKANFALKGAKTDNIVLMNDDMEVIRSDWLTAMIELSTDPGIGAVGARLLHMDGTIQHVGTVLGVNGSVAHAYHSYPQEFVGYNGLTHLIRNYSAVTAACLATRRSVVAQVGWLDENLAIDFNDIDLCLKITAAGYRIAYTPYAELYHFEGVSARREAQNPTEVAIFCQRWRAVIDDDPFYNPNLTRIALDYSEREVAII